MARRRMGEVHVSRLEAILETYEPSAVPPGHRTASAVLVPMQLIDGALHLVYTRRALGLPRHRGQVAFPGGTRDPADADLLATALRESREEIGLAADDVRVLGRLDDIETVASRFVITPWVAMVPHPYPWSPAPEEVDAIFTVGIDRLLAPDAERREIWDFDGHPVPIDLFPVGEHVIWGATHRITRNLLALLRDDA